MLIQTNIQEPITQFGNHWLTNESFAVAVAAIFVIAFLITLGFVGRTLLGRQHEDIKSVVAKLDSVREEIQQMRSTNESTQQLVGELFEIIKTIITKSLNGRDKHGT